MNYSGLKLRITFKSDLFIYFKGHITERGRQGERSIFDPLAHSPVAPTARARPRQTRSLLGVSHVGGRGPFSVGFISSELGGPIFFFLTLFT